MIRFWGTVIETFGVALVSGIILVHLGANLTNFPDGTFWLLGLIFYWLGRVFTAYGDDAN